MNNMKLLNCLSLLVKIGFYLLQGNPRNVGESENPNCGVFECIQEHEQIVDPSKVGGA
jgi:hypothetical protein